MFKVGQKVRHIASGKKMKVKIVPEEHGSKYELKGKKYLAYFYEHELEAIPKKTKIQVYAVCDEGGEIMELCLREEYAEAYIGNPRNQYHIRTATLTIETKEL